MTNQPSAKELAQSVIVNIHNSGNTTALIDDNTIKAEGKRRSIRNAFRNEFKTYLIDCNCEIRDTPKGLEITLPPEKDTALPYSTIKELSREAIEYGVRTRPQTSELGGVYEDPLNKSKS